MSVMLNFVCVWGGRLGKNVESPEGRKDGEELWPMVRGGEAESRHPLGPSVESLDLREEGRGPGL